MPNPGLVGRCGLYCEACTMYGVSHREGEAFSERRRKIAEHFDCTTSDVTCEGCGALGENCWSNDCPLVLCLNEKGFNYCDECSDIDGCEKFGGINERYGNLKESMARLRDIGDEKWLAEKRKERTCPGCGGILYYFDGDICVECAYEDRSNE